MRQVLKGHKGWVRFASASENFSLIVSTSLDNTIKIWNTESGECIQTIEDNKDWVYAAVFSPDGKHIASASRDREIHIYGLK